MPNKIYRFFIQKKKKDLTTKTVKNYKKTNPKNHFFNFIIIISPVYTLLKSDI